MGNYWINLFFFLFTYFFFLQVIWVRIVNCFTFVLCTHAKWNKKIQSMKKKNNSIERVELSYEKNVCMFLVFSQNNSDFIIFSNQFAIWSAFDRIKLELNKNLWEFFQPILYDCNKKYKICNCRIELHIIPINDS